MKASQPPVVKVVQLFSPLTTGSSVYAPPPGILNLRSILHTVNLSSANGPLPSRF